MTDNNHQANNLYIELSVTDKTNYLLEKKFLVLGPMEVFEWKENGPYVDIIRSIRALEIATKKKVMKGLDVLVLNVFNDWYGWLFHTLTFVDAETNNVEGNFQTACKVLKEYSKKKNNVQWRLVTSRCLGLVT